MTFDNLRQQAAEPPDSKAEPQNASSNARNVGEWPFEAFVAAIFSLIIIRALLFS